MYVHYTGREQAEEIARTRLLRTSLTIDGAVYAVAVGGEAVPGVQHDRHGRREAAVLFTARSAPAHTTVEECIWHLPAGLELDDAIVVTADEANTLLDGSRNDLAP